MQSSQYSLPERKDVTARIERMKREQAERDRQLRESQEREQPQEVAQGQ
jgi:hypothetical protein